ncbi:MAG: hypothetical protein R2788_17145 [Saprospiraceae bacterium]
MSKTNPFWGRSHESLESRDFDVRLVTDGQQVMGVFEKYEPDICADVMLPNKDGFTWGKENWQHNEQIPIIF